jgi:hypothetical protein
VSHVVVDARKRTFGTSWWSAHITAGIGEGGPRRHEGDHREREEGDGHHAKASSPASSA